MNEKILFESKKSKLSILFGFLFAAMGGALVNVGLASWLIEYYLTFVILFFVLFRFLLETKIIVTDKRIHGTAAFGKRVDLPLASVSSVGFGLFHSIIIKTSSGRFVFTNLKKRNEIFKVISDLLINRQPTQHTPATIVSETEELNKAEALNDTGVLAHKEYRKRCNVCGHIFCYTDKDIEENEKNEKLIKSARNRAVISAFAGTTIQANMETANADRIAARIKDFNRCSKCNSTDLSEITEEEFSKAPFAAQDAQALTSSADELKKFKELLDMGAITQEEFDAKKKQLLGL